MSSISRARYLCPTAAVPKHRNPIIVRRRCCQRKARWFLGLRKPSSAQTVEQQTVDTRAFQIVDIRLQSTTVAQLSKTSLSAQSIEAQTVDTRDIQIVDIRLVDNRRQPWHTVTRRDCPVESTHVHAFARCWTIVVVASLVVDTVARRRKSSSLGQSLRQRFATARDTSQTPRLSKVRCQTTQLGPLTLCRGMTSHNRPTAAAPRRATTAKRVRERDAILVRRHFPEAL